MENASNSDKCCKNFDSLQYYSTFGGKCNAVLHVMHYIFGGKCTAILSNAVQFSKCTATCNALHSTSLVQYSEHNLMNLKALLLYLKKLYIPIYSNIT